MTDADLASAQPVIKEMFGLFAFRGKSVADSYLGHKASSTPASITVPGGVLDPSQPADLVVDVIFRQTYDERNGRCVSLLYPESEVGRAIASTLNIATPSF